MAEEVKIVDVAGGPAAEATLQEILKIMKGGAGGGGGGGGAAGDKAAAKAQELYTTAVTRGTKTSKDNSNAVKDATESTITFGNTLSSVGGMIGSALGGLIGIAQNFANALTSATTIGGILEAVPVFGSVLGQATGYFQNSVDAFRQLSEVGAGFGNDMMAVRRASAEAGLSIEQFSAMVGNNSQMLNLLGGTASEGAARMGRVTRQLRSQESGLMRLGFTQEQVNEGFAAFVEQQATAGQLRGQTDAQLAAGAQNYMMELDKLSRVTGKSRKELMEQMNQQSQAANVVALRSRLSGTALQNFDNNLATVNTFLPGLGDAFTDAADGIAQTPLAQVLASSVPGFQTLAEQMGRGELTQEQFNQRLQTLGPDIQRFINSMDPAQVQALMGREGFDGLLASSRDITVMNQRMADAQAAAAEQAKRAPLTEMFSTFEQVIQNVRSTFESAFIDSGVLDFIGTEIGKGGENLLAGFQSIANNVKEYLGSEQFRKDFAMVKEKVQNFKDAIMDFVDDIKEFGFIEAVKKLFEGDEAGSEGGMLGMIGDWLGDILYNMLPDIDTLIVGTLGAVGGVLLAGLLGTIIGPLAAPFLAIGGALAAIFGWETVKGWVNDAWEGITGMFSGITEWWNNVDFMTPITDAWNSFTGMFSGIGEWWDGLDFMTPLNNVWDRVTGLFSGIGDWWSNLSFTEMISDAWNKITGVFNGIGEWWNSLSFTDMISNAWNKITGVFGGIGDWWSNLSFTEIISNAWNSITGVFGGIGEWWSNLSFTEIISNAWNSVTSLFNLDGIELPSISDMFSGIIDKVKSFFDFDFELPSFKSFLPSWMGGDSEEPGTTATASVAQPAAAAGTTIDLTQPANITAMGGLDFASQAESARELQAVLADIGAMQSFNNELERIQLGLDNSRINSYNEAMERLVATLEDLNEVLSEDNKGMFGGGTGVSAASVVGNMNAGGANEGSPEQMERLNMLVSQLIALTEEGNRYTRGTMRAIGGNLQMGIV